MPSILAMQHQSLQCYLWLGNWHSLTLETGKLCAHNHVMEALLICLITHYSIPIGRSRDNTGDFNTNSLCCTPDSALLPLNPPSSHSSYHHGTHSPLLPPHSPFLMSSPPPIYHDIPLPPSSTTTHIPPPPPPPPPPSHSSYFLSSLLPS